MGVIDESGNDFVEMVRSAGKTGEHDIVIRPTITMENLYDKIEAMQKQIEILTLAIAALPHPEPVRTYTSTVIKMDDD